MIVRKVSNKLVSFIRSLEGYSAIPYRCAANYITIGWGHEVKRGENFTEITEDQATGLLHNDLLVAEGTVCRLITGPQEDYQYDALVSFCFNLGGARLAASTLRMVVNRGEHDEAPIQIRRWVYAGGKKLKGLVHRRDQEALMYEFGWYD